MDDHIIPVFDLGGVFVDWNPMYLFRKLFDSEEDAQWFHDHICTGDWNLEFDAGEIYAEAGDELVDEVVAGGETRDDLDAQAGIESADDGLGGCQIGLRKVIHCNSDLFDMWTRFCGLRVI